MTYTQQTVAMIIALIFFWASFLVPEITLLFGFFYFWGIANIGRTL